MDEYESYRSRNSTRGSIYQLENTRNKHNGVLMDNTVLPNIFARHFIVSHIFKEKKRLDNEWVHYMIKEAYR
jgi:hypothetical protein